MKFVGIMNEKLQQYYVDTNLRRIRELAGFTQSELAERSGVPLEQLQLFEERKADINRAQAIDIFKMGKILGCGCEELLEI